ncbi:hypothetical protein BDZ85DRAFT_253167 [Elsinoe ampelina]|uniref:Secreted protein n=1 Tax=Elsinoe ampelina TaxID=302913 RepID=A0A6A6FZY7_9PEZI|nr:hypothetical protein BDZ85DRAFT_253167 [Elsinoe ampelina]
MLSLNPIRLLVALLFYSASVVASSTTRWKIATGLTASGAYFCWGGGVREMVTAHDLCSQQGRSAVCILTSSGVMAKHLFFFGSGYLTVEWLGDMKDRIIDHQRYKLHPVKDNNVRVAGEK